MSELQRSKIKSLLSGRWFWCEHNFKLKFSRRHCQVQCLVSFCVLVAYSFLFNSLYVTDNFSVQLHKCIWVHVVAAAPMKRFVMGNRIPVKGLHFNLPTDNSVWIGKNVINRKFSLEVLCSQWYSGWAQ